MTELPLWITNLSKLEILQIESGGRRTISNGPLRLLTLPCGRSTHRENGMTISVSDALHLLKSDFQRQDMAKYESHHLLSVMENYTSISISLHKIPMYMILGADSDVVKILDLSNNGMQKVPHALFLLQGLLHFHLSQNEISHLPDTISNLSALKSLDISFNKVSFLPQSISSLGEITCLRLHENPMTELPLWITHLKNLDVLQIEFQGRVTIQNAPLGISNLPCWKQAQSDNVANIRALEAFRRLNHKIQADGIRRLDPPQLLHIWNNYFSIDFSNNELSSLNIPSVGEFPLKYLNLSRNEIVFLPECLSRLRNLLNLDFSSNKVTHFPVFILQMTRLEVLSFRDNKIQYVPMSLANMSSLKSVSLELNPILNIPQSILGSGWAAISNYLKSPTPILIHFKARFQFLGAPKTGKSSLFQLISSGKKMHQSRNSFQIDGQSCCIQKMALSRHLSDGLGVGTAGIDLWHYSSHSTEYKLHPLYLFPESLIIVTYNTKEPPFHGQLNSFLGVVSKHAPRSAIILVGTHCDQFSEEFGRLFELHIQDLTARYGKFHKSIVSGVLISSLNGFGIDLLWKDIRHGLHKLSWASARSPIQTNSLLLFLQEQGCNRITISYDKVLAHCGANFYVDALTCEQLLLTLRGAGEIIWYHEIAALQGTILLKPMILEDYFVKIQRYVGGYWSQRQFTKSNLLTYLNYNGDHTLTYQDFDFILSVYLHFGYLEYDAYTLLYHVKNPFR
eukprot:TRINITY_DN387_c0_g1_i5.p1 TRINITY_DN387_c0_g1~~TRINITY_DN387_c0_g1_i5.p1  ORF type:complete len:736 (+),score=91.67 TRINITY_DN387_c0_g1_i5:1344-3551(+)